MLGEGFRINAVGHLAADPEKGEKGECRFSLLSNDYAGPGKPKAVTQVWFVGLRESSRSARAIVLDTTPPPAAN